MTDPMPSTEFEEMVKKVVTVPPPDQVFINQLRSQIVKKGYQMIPQKQRFSPRLAWGLAIIFTVLIISLVAFSPTIVEAMKRAFGYIPGAGIVEQNVPLRALAQPLTIERNGVILTVSQAFVSPDKTVISYQVENIPETALAQDFTEEETPTPACIIKDSLRLPDGTRFEPTSGQGNGWGMGYAYRWTFAPLPADVNQATLMISCLMGTAPGLAPEDWEIQLSFIPAPPDLTMVPVIEISTAESIESETSSNLASEQTSTPFDEEQVEVLETDERNLAVQQPLTLERYIEMEDGYVLIGSFHAITTTTGMVTSPFAPRGVRILDANGQEVPFDYAKDIDLPISNQNSSPWAYKLPSKFQAWPLTITLETVDAFMTDVQASITFDTGPSPKSGQEWSLNQTIQIGEYSLNFQTVTRTPDGYHFALQANPEVAGISLAIQNQDEPIQPTGGGGGGGSGSLSSSVSYSSEIPDGELTIHITGLTVLVAGPWSVEWSPENPPVGDLPSMLSDQQPCLTDTIWAQIRDEQPRILPEELSGKLLLYDPNESDSLWGVDILNLADNNRNFLAQGSWPAISPDGTMVIFTGNHGLAIHDFLSDELRTLPAGDITDYGMVWSPDNNRIALIRGSSSQILVMNGDGSGLQRVLDNSAVYHNLIGWADNEQLYITEPGPEGVNIQLLNLADGSKQNLFQVRSNKADFALSPDRQWLAFTDSSRDMIGSGLYVSRPDGSERKFIIALEGQAIYFPHWSPDNRWLLVKLLDLDDPDIPAVQALVEPKTCEVIPLPDLDGEVTSWGP